MSTVKNTQMDPRTRAELEERVRIGKAAAEALDQMDKEAEARRIAEDPRVGQEFYIKFICREVQPTGWARVESQDGDIYEFLKDRLIATDADSVKFQEAMAQIRIIKDMPHADRDQKCPACLGKKALVALEGMKWPARFGANDALIYLIKEAHLDNDPLRVYVRHYEGTRYRVTIEREGK